jgi:NADH-quinone oxidoreductase subunit C
LPDEPTPEAAAAADDQTPEPVVEPLPEPDPVHTELLARLGEHVGDDIVDHASVPGTLVVRIAPEAWGRVAAVAKEQLECDFLSFVSGLDWQPAPREGGEEGGGDTSAPVQPTEMTFGAAGSTGRFQVFARVESTSRRWGVTFKTDVDDQDPVVASWVSVYPGADWHERECWEMFGIRFDGHPSLRHLYLPAEFEGHPLRKDFPLLARIVKPWPGLVDVEGMPEPEESPEPIDAAAPAAVAASADAEPGSSEGGDDA